MLQRLKRWGCYLIIILLLPYIITVFIHGPAAETAADVDETGIRAEHDGKETELSLEEYCIGRLAKEMPASYDRQALMAQAVLVRTAVCGEILKSGSGVVLPDEFWTSEDMRKQWKNGSYRENYEKLKKAFRDTEGQVLMYGDAPVNAAYCRLTNGSTRDGKEVLGSEDYPYLKIKECPLDVEAKEQLQTVVLENMDVQILKTDTAGYVLQVQVGEETVTGEEFRNTYQLASSCFTVQSYDGKLRITTRGVGHGLGMSQYTANRMAKNGDSYEEILLYFFEGCELKEVADIVTNSE